MSAIYRTATVISIAAAMIVMLGGNALAYPIYDFSRCTTEAPNGPALNGQDNWVKLAAIPGTNLTVYNDTTSTGGYDWGNYCGESSLYKDSRSDRANDAGWSISLPNEADFDFSSVFMVDGATNSGVYLYGTGTGFGFAVDVNKTNLRWYWFSDWFRNDDYDESAVHGLTTATAVRVGLDVEYVGHDTGASTYSYKVTPYYTNLSTKVTTSLTEYTLSLSDTALYLPANISSMRVQAQYVNSRIDDIRFVPEPSTLALLATGLIGLLAYAWRKRK